MEKQTTYFRPTTASQRELLFSTWQQTGNVTVACQKARVCRQTFYNWKARFEASGYAGLSEPKSHAPHNPHRTSDEIENQVIAMREQNPKWGKRRIASELAKANDWIPLVSPNTVKRILVDADLWQPIVAEKKTQKPTARTAEKPGQTVNVDLCFVPVTHQSQEKLPAVSGSSGKLRIQPPQEALSEPDYPGRVFEDKSLTYSAAMEAFVKASEEKEKQPSPQMLALNDEQTLSDKEKKRAIRTEEAQLRDHRRSIREQRAKEDVAWKAQRQQRKQGLTQPGEKSAKQRKAFDAAWKAQRQQRKRTLEKRKQENALWREKRAEILARLGELPIITAWVAILVITDNCTRQCLGLPMFIAGAKVTAEAIVDALLHLLPDELQFLISDRGPQFRANIFKQLAKSESFIHVLIARHRPESNGIAERFVRTLKEWLADKQWQDDHQLQQLLLEFLNFYNERPHQGLPRDLSPNELARRLAC